jgi:hypothetical protein
LAATNQVIGRASVMLYYRRAYLFKISQHYLKRKYVNSTGHIEKYSDDAARLRGEGLQGKLRRGGQKKGGTQVALNTKHKTFT